MKNKTILSIFLFLLLSFATTWAADVTVTSSTTKWTDGNTYNVTSNETINSRIIVTGAVTLNLGEGKTLTASKGIELSNGNKLTINGSGTLTATGDTYTVNSVEYWASAIGAFHFGELVINGGTINATGWTNSAGIGGSYSNTGPAGSEKGGSVTINGGTVNATGGYCAPGIGGSKTSTKGSSEGYGITLTINGGKVTARKGSAAEYAIGPGYNGKKTDYTITVGWTNADDFIDHDGLEANPSFVSGKKFARSGETTNITGYAFKTSGKYVPGATVTFEANGGSSVSAQSVAIGSTASKPTAPTRTGYVFAGWTKGDDAYDFGTAVNDDITLIAQWEKQAVVTFNSNGGTDVAVQYVTKGSTANEPIAPTRDGYNFRGWTLGGNPYDFSTAVNDDIELIAQWSAITTLKLSSKTDNTGVLATAVSGDLYNVTLSDRTIFADGSWNTLTLPFSLTASQIAASPLANLTIKEMNTATSGLDGEKLTLNFKDATTIEAGKPYIVKWQADAKYDLLIRNKSDWDAFANRVNNGETFEGKTVMLANDFDNSASPVTKMVGYYSWNETSKVATSKPFKGVFDGNGRTLTVNISSDEEYTAPFRSVIGATVKNLTVAGNIQVSHKLVGGMIAFAAGNNLISKCRVSATITSSVNGDGTVGGLVSNIQGGNTSIENCLFDGSFVGSNTTRWSGFVGWIESMATASHTGTAGSLSISYSLFSPASINVQSNSGNSTFYRGRSGYTPSLTKYYYTKSFVDGTKQGTDASSKSASTLVSASYLGSNNWEVVSDNAVPKMTTTTTSHADIVNPTFSNVTIDAKASTVATIDDGKVSLIGTYSPFTSIDGLLFDEHNTANGAFYAALSATQGGYTFSGWYTDADKNISATSIPFGIDGSATLYTKWKKLLTNSEISIADISDTTYTGLAIEPEISVTDGETPLKLGTDYTVSYSDNINAGSATVTITGNGDYGGTVEKTFTITRAPLTITALNDTIVYGDEPSNAGVKFDGFVNEENEKSLNGTLVYSNEYKQYGNVGDYAISPSGLTADNYEITFVDGKLTVEPKYVAVTWDKQNTFTYDGFEQAPTATLEGVLEGDACELTVTGAEKNAGKYTATATRLSNANYKLPAAGLEQAFEIVKADPTMVKAPTAVENLVYNGKAQTLVTAGDAKNGVMVYKLEGAEKYSETLPTATEVGDYTIYFMVQGDENYNDLKARTLTATIIAPASSSSVEESSSSVEESSSSVEIASSSSSSRNDVLSSSSSNDESSSSILVSSSSKNEVKESSSSSVIVSSSSNVQTSSSSVVMSSSSSVVVASSSSNSRNDVLSSSSRNDNVSSSSRNDESSSSSSKEKKDGFAPIVASGLNVQFVRNELTVTASTASEVKVYVFDLQGNLKKQYHGHSAGTHNVSLNQMNRGLYLVRVVSGSNVRTLRAQVK